MSENREPSESFPEVAHLLRLKKHEVPPPGYFNGFSAKVIARIEADALAQSQSEAGKWWSALLAPISWQRGMAGANTLLVVGIGITGVAAYQSLQPSPEDEQAHFAALQLPATSGSNAEKALGLAGVATASVDAHFRSTVSLAGDSARPMVRSAAYPASFTPVQYATTTTTIEGGAEVAPAALFAPPTVQSLQTSQPRFVFQRE